MSVTYGCDYSTRELSAAELDGYAGYDLRFLIRYIGWPGNPKCISHYPGAYQAHVDGGRLVLLVAEQGTHDPAGGFAAGAAMAERAVADARAAGYPDRLPIFFSADGWLAASGIAVATALSYLDGAASVPGQPRVGAYGFRDFIGAARADGHAAWWWLCGSPPTDAEVAQGWPHIYQWNGGTIHPTGLAADLDWAYPGVLEALTAAAAPSTSPAPAPPAPTDPSITPPPLDPPTSPAAAPSAPTDPSALTDPSVMSTPLDPLIPPAPAPSAPADPSASSALANPPVMPAPLGPPIPPAPAGP